MSPSNLPSRVNSPENLMLPLISTSALNTFFDEAAFILSIFVPCLVEVLLTHHGGNASKRLFDIFSAGRTGVPLVLRRIRVNAVPVPGPPRPGHPAGAIWHRRPS